MPIFEALPFLEADHHPVAIDIGGSQVDRFRDAQAGGIAGRQDCVVLGSLDAGESVDDLIGS